LPELSLAEWIVLSLTTDGPTHGFAIAAATARDGEIGRAWHVQRPIVYRCLDRLAGGAMIRAVAVESGDRGPNRTLVEATDEGSDAVRTWLLTPVAHVRDLRSELLVKLALLARGDGDSAPLIRVQRAALGPIADALGAQLEAEAGFDRVLTSWRAENAQAALRFLDRLEPSRRSSPRR
jgi:PadR family transcriptional regulator AphA